MKKILFTIALLTQVGCTSISHYPPEGNVSAESYQHVSGVYNRRNASTETAILVGSATVSAATGGTQAPGNPAMRTYTVLVPNPAYKLPEGCEILDGSNP